MGYNASESTVEQHIYSIERKNLKFYMKQEYLPKTRPNKDVFRHTEAKRLHHQHTVTIINVKEVLPAERKLYQIEI